MADPVENGGEVLNSKRQRRPSVRLGEIGDIPIAFLVDRPLKRRKRRVALAPGTEDVSLPEVGPFDNLLEDDVPLMDVDMDADVDMTGFNLDDAATGLSCWDDRAPKTRPLEHVANESAAVATPAVADEHARAAVPSAETAAAHEQAVTEAEAATEKNNENTGDEVHENMEQKCGRVEVEVVEDPLQAVEKQEEQEEGGNNHEEEEQEAGEEEVAVKNSSKSRSRAPKSKYGRRKRANTSRGTSASWRSKKAAAAEKKEKEANTMSEDECNGDDAKEDEHVDGGSDGKQVTETGEAETEADKEAPVSAATTTAQRSTRGFKTLRKDADTPSRELRSSRVSKSASKPSSNEERGGDDQQVMSGDDEPPPIAPASLEQQQQEEHQEQQQEQLQQLQQQQQQKKQKSKHQKQQKQQQQQQHQHQQPMLLENGAVDSGGGETGAAAAAAAAAAGKDQVQVAEEQDNFVLPEFVRKWLCQRKLGKYVELFEFHEVDEEVLPLLTMEDLRDMGIVAVGTRRKLFQAIQDLG